MKSKLMEKMKRKFSDARTRQGCDVCKRDHATEYFIGAVGTKLWIGGACLKSSIERKMVENRKRRGVMKFQVSK